MSEAPEKKVLRELLSELKAKTMISEERFQKSVADVDKRIIKLWEMLERLLDKKQIEKTIATALGLLITSLDAQVEMSFTHSMTTLEDFKIYVGALERYSSELDQTLSDIFEQAKKMAEEQRKKQEELMKRKAPESYRV